MIRNCQKQGNIPTVVGMLPCMEMVFLEFGAEQFLIVCFRRQRKLTPSDASHLLTRCACMWTFFYAHLHAMSL